jgi:flavin-dependent dehydrogenase
MNDDLIRTDVTVIGGGLAGMAASIHLAKAGLNVLCIEPAIEEGSVVGESLDWSAPELLRSLGLPMERLIAEEIATWKRHIVLQLGNGSTYHYVPGQWLERSPWNVELRTLHVDRTRLRNALTKILLQQGVWLMNDRVSAVDQENRRVTALTTQGGKRITSSFYVDASGFAASLFPRIFHLRSHLYGPRKVAIWSYFEVSDVIEGTTVYADDVRAPYLEWVWEIPVQPQTISVGYVAPGGVIKAMRQQGNSVDEIYRERLSQIPRFQPLLHTQQSAAARVVSFRCGAYRNICGPNWLVVGDAASMVDPMTSNGVTAALRHAEEASRLIERSLRQGRFPRLAAALYSRRALEMARFFNCGIERLLYASPVRNSIGINVAGSVYTIPAWLMNLFYSRMQPRGLISTALFCLVLQLLRLGASVFYWLCRRFAKPSTAEVGFAS